MCSVEQQVFEMQSSGLGTDPQSFCYYRYFIAKFEISPEIGSGV